MISIRKILWLKSRSTQKENNMRNIVELKKIIGIVNIYFRRGLETKLKKLLRK